MERAWNVWLRDPATLRQRGAGGVLPYVTDSRLHSLPLAPQAQLQMQCLLRGYRGRLEMLDRWEERLSALDLPVAAQLRAIGLSQSNLWQQVGNRGNATTRVRAFWDLDFRLMELLEPKFLASFQENALIRAGLANAQTVVALERWRRAHPGQWPDRLADLVPAYLKVVPLDPFTGEPVRFRRLPQGYVVYCVGMDLTDDGGKEGGRGENPGTDSTLRVLQ